jgi:hypothetical protein
MAYTGNVAVIGQNWIDQKPTTLDWLRPNAFLFRIKDLPNISFTCQSANLPQIAFGSALQPTPFIDIPRIGEKLSFGEFTIRFLVTEDMSNYLELYRWLIALGFPNDYNEFNAFTSNRKERVSKFPFFVNGRGEKETLAYSDGILTILDSTNNPKTNIIYKDMFPISLEALDFDIASSTVEYFTVIASFKYRIFEVETI